MAFLRGLPPPGKFRVNLPATRATCPECSQKRPMPGFDSLLALLILGLVGLAVAGLYLWLLREHTRALFAAMARLRDRIDRSRRW